MQQISQADRRTDGHTSGRLGGLTNGWTYGQIGIHEQTCTIKTKCTLHYKPRG